ncbi:uncharacterized protein LOC117817673 isoform X2 [Scomber scombrus]|uniref:Uncharacterized protein LOC117817673 isoform X2 n=1 Tax=Scomber scombrus TaxID=13677 RepID=A0AAV1PU88_SCOSC
MSDEMARNESDDENLEDQLRLDAILADLHDTERKEMGEQGKRATAKVKHTEKDVRWRKYGRLMSEMRPSAGG